jgi:2-polyprenyl-3-methyl-5-hydroxy-6-metoxy-1,4-benzoquinol methylase
MHERQVHWENVYASKAETEVSWYEESPDLSLALLEEAGIGTDAAVIDIGGGASKLVDALLARGQAHIAVLDLSSKALEHAQARVGPAPVEWIISDVTAWQPRRRYDVWHDRAAFHFLVEPDQQRQYVEVLSQALESNGVVIIGTFAPDGPDKCSGLPVARHDANSLSRVLGRQFSLLAHRVHDHITPWGSIQRFQFSTFRRA